MTIEQKRRELFEAWAHQRDFAICRMADGYYSNAMTGWAWSSFNAALDAVVIELPQQWNDDGCGAFYREDCGPHMDAKEVIAAIESTGLGLKVKS